MIRLYRAGKKNQPFFKIVVTDKKNAPRGGRPVEVLGFFNPLTKEKKIDAERAKYWLSVGAQPSDTLRNFLISAGIMVGKKVDVHKKSKKTAEAPIVPVASTVSATQPAAAKVLEVQPAAEDLPADEAGVLKDAPASASADLSADEAGATADKQA